MLTRLRRTLPSSFRFIQPLCSNEKATPAQKSPCGPTDQCRRESSRAAPQLVREDDLQARSTLTAECVARFRQVATIRSFLAAVVLVGASAEYFRDFVQA